VFSIGYFLHLRKTTKEHDEYFENRTKPDAFTLQSKISNEMWEKSKQEYESNQIDEKTG